MDKIKWNKTYEVLERNLFDGFYQLAQPPPPVEDLIGIANYLAEQVGRAEIALTLRVCVRVAVDEADKVFKAIAPSMKRPLDQYEQYSMWALWHFFFTAEGERARGHSAKVRREWADLVGSGPMGDVTQIFLELACFRKELRPLLLTIR